MFNYTPSLQAMETTGVVYDVVDIDKKIIEAIDEWDANLTTTEVSWILRRKATIIKAVLYIIRWTDVFINLVEGQIENGPDKKATVIRAIGLIFDYSAKESLPFFLKPFSGYIKKFIVDTVVSGFIDFVVNKYNNGFWKKTKEGNTNGQTNNETST